MPRNYQLKKPTVDTATAITVPATKSEKPKKIKLTEEEVKALKGYINAKRAVTRNEIAAKAIVQKHGKIAFHEATLAPNRKGNYEYPVELQEEIDAVQEKKKAAQDSGAASKTYGAMSITFADKKRKARKGVKP